jgi:hypothetical protein
MKAQLRKVLDGFDQANIDYGSEADEYDQGGQKMHAALVATIAAVDLEIRSSAR